MLLEAEDVAPGAAGAAGVAVAEEEAGDSNIKRIQICNINTFLLSRMQSELYRERTIWDIISSQ